MNESKGAKKIKFVLMKEHPLMGYALLFMVGAYLSLNVSIPMIVWDALLVISIISIFAMTIFKRRSWMFVLIVFLSLGYISGINHIPSWYNEYYAPPADAQITGKVEDVKATGYSYEYILSDVSINHYEIDSKIKISNITDRDYIDAGNVVYLYADLEKPAEAQQNGMFSERRYYMTKDIQYLATIFDQKVTVLKHGDDEQPVKIRLQNKIYNQFNGDFNQPVLGVLYSLSTGNKDYLDDEFYTMCQDLGIAHIFAISGLHIGALLILWELYCKKTRKRFLTKILGSTVLVIILYMVVGSRASLLRAIAMWALVIVYQYTGRKGNIIDFLAIAMLVLLAVNPLYVIDIGFLLSVTCVGAIGLVYTPLAKAKKSEKANKIFNFYPVSMFLLSLCILSMSWIITAKVFGQVAILSPIWNVFLVPIAMVLIALMIIYAFTFYIPIISLGVVWTIEKITSLIVYLVKVFSKANIDINMPSISLAAALGIIVLLLLMTDLIIKNRKIIRVAIGVVCIGIIMASVIFIPPKDRMDVYTGYDNCFVYILEQNKSMVIVNTDDGGIERVLRDIDENKVDILLYTGNDIEDLEELIENIEDISFDEIIVHSNLMIDYKGAHGYTTINSGEIINFGNSQIYVDTFRANPTAIIHYYADIQYYDRQVIYIDPLRLREGAIQQCEIMICSRWTKQRIENLIYANPEYVIINSRDYLMSKIPISENEEKISIFNINNMGSFTYIFEGAN